MKEMITRKYIVLFIVLLSAVLISNCSSDQNMTGYTDSQNLPLARIDIDTIDTEELVQEAEEIEIQVSPNILNLESNGIVVTIHTDIEYWTVFTTLFSCTMNSLRVTNFFDPLC